MFNVFIVDDEPFIIEGLYDILDWAEFGLEIAGHAENGQAALAGIRNKPVDILITDISMPVMNGLSLIREARKTHPELKVIILSGYNDFEYVREGLTLGVENYLLKPINIDELQETLKGTVRKLNATRMERALAEFDVRIIRDNILYRWLTWQITPAIMQERAEVLHIDLSAPYVMAALVRIETEKDTTHLLDQLEQHLASFRGMIPFRNVEGELDVIITLRDREADKALAMGQLQDLKRLPGLSGTAIRIACGSIEPMDIAATSYANANRAWQYFFLYPDREWIDYSELPTESRELEAFPVEWGEYAKSIVAKDKDQLFTRIDEDFARLLSFDGITPKEAQTIALELLVRFKMELQEIRHTEQSELFKPGLERVLHATTIADLTVAVKEAAGLTVDALDRDVKSPIIQQILHHVHEHYAESLSLKTLGQLYNIHPVYLGQLFHKETNDSFAEYINKYRIEKAKELLKDPRLKVHEIANQVGYWETGYFYKQFKKYVNISPTEYKALF
ncbi:response regulator [Paenibacillus sp. GCM10027626]|uniref:response regulator n=1 Tax=Paenibacillus sp. GCM10027626 TaxID=3273411 RepID=UPI003636423B